jgi:hypothetical protein
MMGQITGKEPKHWHDASGRHRMPDPRRLAKPEPVVGEGGEPTGEMSVGQTKKSICAGNPDMAAYWDHLDEHDRLGVMPERREDDPPEVQALFDKIENNEAQNATMWELIAARRQQAGR